MDKITAVDIILAVIAVVSYYHSRTRDTVHDSSVIARLSATIEELRNEIVRLNRNVEILTEKTNEFNRDIAVLELRVTTLHERLDNINDRVGILENRDDGMVID